MPKYITDTFYNGKMAKFNQLFFLYIFLSFFFYKLFFFLSFETDQKNNQNNPKNTTKYTKKQHYSCNFTIIEHMITTTKTTIPPKTQPATLNNNKKIQPEKFFVQDSCGREPNKVHDAKKIKTKKF